MPLPLTRFLLLLFAALLLMFQEVQGQQHNIAALEKQLEQTLKKRNHAVAAQLSYELAAQLWQNNQRDNALRYAADCIKYSKKAGNALLQLKAHQQLALMQTQNGQPGKATDHYLAAIKLAKELYLPEQQQQLLVDLSISYGQTGRYKKAIAPLEEALTLAQQHSNWPLQQKCYQLLQDFHQKLGEPHKAEAYQNLYEQAQESLIAQTKLVHETKKLKQAKDSLSLTKSSLQEVKTIVDQRQLEIELLQKDKELADLHIREQHARLEFESWIRNSILCGLLLVSMMTVVAVQAYRKKREASIKIEKQNKNISSSINYAKRIQEAMLPKASQQQNLLPESFILFKPRDGVSGDFYWFKELADGAVAFAAADCTGHGVPGAFMSLIGINTLNSIASRGINQSDEMLHALDAEIQANLQQQTSGNNDGMDIALCIYRKGQNLLEYSGAKNSLVYIQNGQFHQLKATPFSIGGKRGKENLSFKKHSIRIDQPTTIYLFSDGYRDQFGQQEKGKFLSRRFHELLLEIHELPMAAQQERLHQVFEDWKGSAPQTDDVLVMGIKLT